MEHFTPEEHSDGEAEVKLLQLAEGGCGESLHGYEGVGEMQEQLGGKFYSSKQEGEEGEVTSDGGDDVVPKDT